MLFGPRTIAKGLALGLLAVASLILAVDYSDAKRGGGGRGGGGFRGGSIGGGGGNFGGGGFHHRPSGGGSYYRPGGGFDGRAHIDNSLPGRPDHGLPGRPGDGRPNRPGGGGDNNKPGDGGQKPAGGYNNGYYDDYYYGWDDPTYGYTGMAVGTYVHSVPTTCVYEQYGGVTYRRCGEIWYEPRYEDVGIRYVVVDRPF